MSPNHLEAQVQEILFPADVRINGSQRWDSNVHNEGFYARVRRQSSVGLGETYMDGWWNCRELDQFFFKIFAAGIEQRAARSWHAISLFLKSIIFNPQTKSRSTEAAKEHHDLGNELFQAMLDRRMVYTCGRWKQAANLIGAEEILPSPVGHTGTNGVSRTAGRELKREQQACPTVFNFRIYSLSF